MQNLNRKCFRILLRKVGGGYVFIHRMLLEWFAAHYQPGQQRQGIGRGLVGL